MKIENVAIKVSKGKFTYRNQFNPDGYTETVKVKTLTFTQDGKPMTVVIKGDQFTVNGGKPKVYPMLHMTVWAKALTKKQLKALTPGAVLPTPSDIDNDLDIIVSADEAAVMRYNVRTQTVQTIFDRVEVAKLYPTI